MAEDTFAWAQNNLGAQTPHGLQDQGVDVDFAPNIPVETKVVNLADGSVQWFHEREERPPVGYYADFESLARYCREHGIPLNETNGLVTTEPIGTRTAGNPLPRGGS